MTTRTPVLCVDDEPHVIDGLALHLRHGYQVVAAHSGPEGLATLRERGPFAVVLSDMRMPGMDGATFLRHVRDEAPDSTRLLLTGHADTTSAIAAVNDGQVFRFLTKPCAPSDLRQAVDAAAEHHRLVTTEKVLLEQTLLGCIQALSDILAVTSPVVFGRSTRIRATAVELCRHTAPARQWVVEVAAMLAHLGYVAVPEEVVRKQQSGEPLTAQELAMVAPTAAMTASIIGRIPRLEPVLQVLTLVARAREETRGRPVGADRSAAATAAEYALEAAILRLATDFDDLESRGLAPEDAVDTLRGRGTTYDARLLDILTLTSCTAAAGREVREVGVGGLRPGMVLGSDVYMSSGVLLVARGFTVTDAFLHRIRNFGPGRVTEPLRVILPTPRAQDELPYDGRRRSF